MTCPSVGDARIRVDRCPTTYFSGRCSYLDRQGDTGDEAGAGCGKATARRRRSRRRGANCRWAGWPSFGHAELALTIMLDDLGRFDCSVADGVDADSEPSSPLLALAGLVGLGRPSQQV